MSTLVGSLYEQGDDRRDAGFSIFYMGINLGAFLGPIVAGYLAQQVDWHLGFACAGVGMTLGLRAHFPGHRPLWQLCNTVNKLRWTRNAPNSGSD